MALSADGTLLVAAGTNLVALSASEGRVLWQMSSPNANPFGPPVLDYDGTLYAPVKGGILALQLEHGPAASAWPMYRQNPRQSACIQRLSTPQLRASYKPPGHVTLDVLAPGGCVILQSDDLRTWRKLDSQPPSTDPISWRIATGTESPGFFRLLSIASIPACVTQKRHKRDQLEATESARA